MSLPKLLVCVLRFDNYTDYGINSNYIIKMVKNILCDIIMYAISFTKNVLFNIFLLIYIEKITDLGLSINFNIFLQCMYYG